MRSLLTKWALWQVLSTTTGGAKDEMLKLVLCVYNRGWQGQGALPEQLLKARNRIWLTDSEGTQPGTQQSWTSSHDRHQNLKIRWWIIRWDILRNPCPILAQVYTSCVHCLSPRATPGCHKEAADSTVTYNSWKSTMSDYWVSVPVSVCCNSRKLVTSQDCFIHITFFNEHDTNSTVYLLNIVIPIFS